MTRETKINLGFLIAFLALSLPGAAILFVKKLAPGQRMLYEPSFMRRTEAYNNPLPATSSSVRTFPPKTLAWTAAVAREQTGRPAYRRVAAGGREEPLVSDARRFEVLDAAPGEMAVLFWSDTFAAGDGARITGTVGFGAGDRPVTAASAKTLVVPENVIQELLDEGFQKPPRRVGLLRLSWDQDAAGELPRRVALTWREADGREARDAASWEPALLAGALSAPAATRPAGLDAAAGVD